MSNAEELDRRKMHGHSPDRYMILTTAASINLTAAVSVQILNPVFRFHRPSWPDHTLVAITVNKNETQSQMRR